MARNFVRIQRNIGFSVLPFWRFLPLPNPFPIHSDQSAHDHKSGGRRATGYFRERPISLFPPGPSPTPLFDHLKTPFLPRVSCMFQRKELVGRHGTTANISVYGLDWRPDDAGINFGTEHKRRRQYRSVLLTNCSSSGPCSLCLTEEQ